METYALRAVLTLDHQSWSLIAALRKRLIADCMLGGPAILLTWTCK
eukprot:CAMPEP_0115725720 /NCGR_PEP_ID=MMETSP0272-20121206/81459_1 /TAXON_ID=71861 /ORGANISM="Scrippsiella trochoidea, Strain CCMP3099" /LENGTH=45 /DNA_ID= /DNA_START= /DNA_END= /DNA_ORIENTATION=